MRTETPESYVCAIRNDLKRDFARRYLGHLREIQAGRKSTSPKRPDALSFMAAQAVWMRLHSLTGVSG